MPVRLRQRAASSTLSGADFSLHFSEAVQWLENLLQLVDSEVDYSALKFSNYLEAEMQLFRRMPQLRAVCKEARRMCRSNPSISPYIASRMGQLQATWLAVESRLAQFKTKKALLTALSVDLKQLETNECDNQPDSDCCTPGKHICCTRKIELLDGAIQKKDGQMQQMLSVTGAISKLLDWLCASDFLGAADRSKSTTTATSVSTNSPAAVVSPAEDSIAATAAAAAAAEAALVARDPQSISSTGSTTYLRTVTNTDGDQADLVSSESSEIIVQTGHNSTQLGAAATSSSNGHYPAMRRRPSESNRSSRQSDPSTSVTGSEQVLEVGIESTNAAAAAQRDNHNALACCASTDTETTSLRLSEAKDSTEDATAADTDCDDFSLSTRDKIATATSGLSPRLRAVGNRLAALKVSVQIVQARLLHSGAAEDAAQAQTSQMDLVENGLKDWQCELASLRAGLLEVRAAGAEEAIFQRAYLESIALLSNWTDSLRDRCKSRLVEQRQAY